jgi:FKBP-type peptidyl-prolyl cis-trans isomerase FklB
MKPRLLAVLFVLTLAVEACAADKASTKGDKVSLEDKKSKVSYAIGSDIGSTLKKQMIEVDPDVLSKGLKDVYSGGKSLMSDNEVRTTLMEFQKELMAKQQEHVKQLGEKNRQEGEKFLEDNKKKQGVVARPSGLQYKVVKEGTGPKPQDSDVVEVNYRGTLVDGTEFDSSYKRGTPATFPVNGVIAGWTEALKLMPVGSKWTLYVPPALAYGERGAGRDVPPNSTLIFDVELLGIKTPAGADQAPEKPAGHK